MVSNFFPGNTVRIFSGNPSISYLGFLNVQLSFKNTKLLSQFFSRQYSQKFIRTKLNEIYTDRLE